MNGLGLFITVSAVAGAVLTGLFSFFGKQRADDYKDRVSFFESANSELHQQNSTLRTEKADLTAAISKLQAQTASQGTLIEELRDINLRLPDFTKLTIASNELMTLMSNNHKQTISKLTELGKVISRGNR